MLSAHFLRAQADNLDRKLNITRPRSPRPIRRRSTEKVERICNQPSGRVVGPGGMERTSRRSGAARCAHCGQGAEAVPEHVNRPAPPLCDADRARRDGATPGSTAVRCTCRREQQRRPNSSRHASDPRPVWTEHRPSRTPSMNRLHPLPPRHTHPFRTDGHGDVPRGVLRKARFNAGHISRLRVPSGVAEGAFERVERSLLRPSCLAAPGGSRGPRGQVWLRGRHHQDLPGTGEEGYVRLSLHRPQQHDRDTGGPVISDTAAPPALSRVAGGSLSEMVSGA